MVTKVPFAVLLVTLAVMTSVTHADVLMDTFGPGDEHAVSGARIGVEDAEFVEQAIPFSISSEYVFRLD